MISTEQMIIRLVVAALLGSVIGLERERLDRAAGLRTHALVSVGATLFMLVSAFGFRDVHGVSQVVLDPSRVAAQVVSGIGFLGAGTIIVQRGSVRGLTTAASVWAVAAIGLAVGGGLFIPAIVATAVMLVILVAIKPIEKRITTNRNRSISLTLDSDHSPLQAIKKLADTTGIVVRKIVLVPSDQANQDRAELHLGNVTNERYVAFVDQLRKIQGIKHIDMAMTATKDRDEDLERT